MLATCALVSLPCCWIELMESAWSCSGLKMENFSKPFASKMRERPYILDVMRIRVEKK